MQRQGGWVGKDFQIVNLCYRYPTSSFDFSDLMNLLSKGYYVCVIDAPGYGLSDKPRNGYKYSTDDDAKLADHYIKNVLKLKSFTLLTHDKGNSVALALLGFIRNKNDYTIKQHIIPSAMGLYKEDFLCHMKPRFLKQSPEILPALFFYRVCEQTAFFCIYLYGHFPFSVF
jgi:alpha/beta hydrolase fold